MNIKRTLHEITRNENTKPHEKGASFSCGVLHFFSCDFVDRIRTVPTNSNDVEALS